MQDSNFIKTRMFCILVIVLFSEVLQCYEKVIKILDMKEFTTSRLFDYSQDETSESGNFFLKFVCVYNLFCTNNVYNNVKS